MKISYTIEIEHGKVKLTAQYGTGSRCETYPKSFDKAMELIEKWYAEDLNITAWGNR